MSARQIIALAAFGSMCMLLGAFAFQHLGGLAPCKMCIWQRYPHAIAAGIGVLALAIPRVWIACLGAFSAAVTAMIGMYHSGVELGYWEGPSSCTSGSISGLSADDLMAQIMAAPLVRCDDIAWQLLGISMAGWNAIVSWALCAVWLWAARTIYVSTAKDSSHLT